MATFTAQGTLPVAGAGVNAAPISDTFTHIISTLNGNNLNKTNVDYTNTDGIVVLNQAQTRTAALTQKATFTVGEDDAGHDVQFFGATSGKSMLWDESADKLLITGDCEVTGTLTASGSATALGDNDQLQFGAGTDYWLVYDATNTAFELNSTNISGGTDGVIFDVQDGTNDTRFYGGLSLDGQTAPTAGLVLNGDIDMTTNGNRIDLDTDNDTSIRASADDTIMIEVAGADDFSITANSFNVLSGSVIDLADNATVTFGDGDDATIKWDASNLAVSAGTAAVNITAGYMTLYDDNNNADVHLTMGTSATESLKIQVLNGGLNKTAEEVKFITATASGTADYGKMTFNVDGSDIVSIDDDGLSLNGAKSIDTGGDNDLTLNAGTADVVITASDLDVNGNADVAGTLTVGVDDTGYDVQMFGAAAGAYLLWDESANALDIRGATAAGPGAISLETGELTVVDGDILGRIDFSAPAESSGTDAVLVGASIWAESDDTFATDNNATSLVFAAATSETAAAVMRLSKTALTPQTTDGLSLGTSALNFSDLFLDDGAVINFNSGDVTVTHSSNTLTITGGITALDTSSTIGNLTLADGSITDSSGAISFGDENLTTTGVITGATVEATGDTSAGDNAAMGYTSAEGLILTGQGSTNDVTIKNDADTTVMSIATGTDDVTFADDLLLSSGAVVNFDSGDVTVTHAAGKLTFGGDGAVELDFNNHEMTNVDIDSGAIDGVTIGAASAAAGSFAALTATSLSVSDGSITNVNDIALDSISADGSSITVSNDVFTANNTGIVVGHSAQVTTGGAVQELQVLGTSNAADASIGLNVYSDNIGSSGLYFGKSRATSIGTYTIVQNNDQLGIIDFYGADGTDMGSNGAYILAAVDGTPGSNDMPGRLVFATTADGAASATERMRINSGGQVFINDTANAESTIGLTINQGANDNEILSFKSSDITHGMTDQTETDTYSYMKKANPTEGGLNLSALAGTGTSIVLNIDAMGGTANTTKTTGGWGLVNVNARQRNGSNIGAVDSDGNVFSVRAQSPSASLLTKFMIDEDGDVYAVNTTVQAFSDDKDDVKLLRALDHTRAGHGTTKGFVKSKWDEFVKYNEQDLVDAGVLGDTVENGGMWNVTQHVRLQNGALWQMYERLLTMAENLENNVPSLKGKLLPQLGA
jgi:hypothetical protein